MLNTYFRMKPVGAWCAWPPFSCVTIEALLRAFGRTGFSLLIFVTAEQMQNRQAEACPTENLLVCRCLVLHPFFEIRFGHHTEHGVHAVVAQSAKFGAGNFIVAGIGRR